MMQNIQVSNTFLQGHRAELYAARVAKCLAAMEGREKVFEDDLKKAVKYMISVNSSHLFGRARVSPSHGSQVVGVDGGRPRLELCSSAAGRRGDAVAEEVRRLGLEESGG
jgi:Mg-chelatase subunit ChlI